MSAPVVLITVPAHFPHAAPAVVHTDLSSQAGLASYRHNF